MAVADRVKRAAAILFGNEPKIVAPKAIHPTGLQRPVTKEMEEFDRISLREDRWSVIRDCQKMAATDTRVGRAIFKLGGDATVGSFMITIEEAPNDALKELVRGIFDSTLAACKVRDKTKGWIHSLLEDGDTFFQIEVNDAEGEITRVKRLAAIITESNMNSAGDFPPDKPAYYQIHPWSREKIKEFEGWQIVQAGWQRKDGAPYGKSMFAPARMAFKRLDEGDKNLVIRRTTRAGSYLHHQVGTPETPGEKSDVDAYKEMNQDTFENPMNPIKDIFSNGLVKIDELSGDTTIGELSDLEYFEGCMMMISGIPYALLGAGRERNVNRDILEEQEEDYYRVIADITDTMGMAFRAILNFSLLLKEVNPESIKWTMEWGSKDRDDLNDKLERAAKMQSLGFSFETIFNICQIADLSYEEELDRIRTQIEDGLIPYGLNTRMDPIMAALMTGFSRAGSEPPKAEQLIEKIEQLKEIAEKGILPGGRMPKPIVRIG